MKAYEGQLLGRMLMDREVYFQNLDRIKPGLFHEYKQVFKAYEDIVKDGRHPSLEKIKEKVPHGQQDLTELLVGIDWGIPLNEIFAELEEGWKNREINNAITQAALMQDSDKKMDVLTNALTGLYQHEHTVLIDGYKAAKDALDAVLKKTEVEMPTGFRYLDNLTGGLQRSDLMILAGETSQGKTALALNVAQNVLDGGASVLFLSMEMSVAQLMLRMVCTKAGIAKNEIKEKYAEVQNVAAGFKESKLHIADVHNNSLQHIIGIIRGAHIRHGISVAFVDYLQLLTDKSKNSREQEIGHIARALKNLAKELDICIVALSQLGRPRQGQNHKPTLSRLRDSGQIEEAADVVMFVYRPEYYGIEEYEGQDTEGLADLIIAKGRNYGVGSFIVEFRHEITKFVDREKNDAEAYMESLQGAKFDKKLPF